MNNKLEKRVKKWTRIVLSMKGKPSFEEAESCGMWDWMDEEYARRKLRLKAGDD
jgi:hypothetical protein